MNNIKCLIIDDDKKIRDSIYDMISEFHHNWEVEISTDGLEGITKLTQEAKFDIVLTDYEMKPKNGLDVLEHIHNNSLDVLSVMITSHANPTTFKGSLKFRVAGFIEKPINANDLLAFLKKLEDEVIVKKKHKELLEIGRNSAMILHDIKSPLSVIMGSSEIINDKVSDELALKVSQKISKSTDRIIEIINNVQEKIKNPSYDSSKDFKVVTTNLKEIIPSLQEYMEYRKIIIDYSFDLKENFVALKDVDLYQIFTNLINNSLDAISDQPIQEQWIKVSIRGECSDYVIISIQDSGNGILQKNIDKIFNPLFSQKKSEKGTGLGLNIVKDLLLSSGGDIAYNPSSKNTEFLITLPKSK